MLSKFNFKNLCNKTINIPLEQGEIIAKEWGNPKGNPVIAIHGWLDNMASFYPLLTQSDWATKNNLRIITIDLPGHGHSSHRHLSHPNNFIEYIQDLHEIVEYFNFSRFSIIGHSMGAGIASIYAGTFPEKVNSLMLIEGFGPMTLIENDAPEQLAKSISQRNRHKNRDNHYYEDIQPFIDARVKTSELSEDNVRLLVERNMQHTVLGFHWRSDPRLRLPTAIYLTPKQVKAFHGNLTMPVIMVYGKQGFVHKYELLNQRIEDSEFLETKELDGGHHLHMEYPEQVIEVFSEFLLGNNK